MDTLYIGDIPEEYHFAVFNDNYIDLYNNSDISNCSDYYRLYLYDNVFLYEYKIIEEYENISLVDIAVSNDYIYRRDFPSIVFISTIFILFIVVLLNLVTSVFKRGGIFSGLL